MRKLKKRFASMDNSIEAYACDCTCSCICPCDCACVNDPKKPTYMISSDVSNTPTKTPQANNSVLVSGNRSFGVTNRIEA